MTSGRRILIVDNDDTQRRVLSEQLQLHEIFTPTEALTGAQALESVKTDYFDLIILEVSLPDLNGHDVCGLMRKHGVMSPIVMLSDSNTDADIILGLGAGAIDYLARPFHVGVLMARLRAHLRAHERTESALLTIGPYTFHQATRILFRKEDNRKIHLTDKEAEILKFFYRTGNKIISRKVLLDKVWRYNEKAVSHTLETHLYRLRQKIEPDPSNASILITVAGGYRLAAGK